MQYNFSKRKLGGARKAIRVEVFKIEIIMRKLLLTAISAFGLATISMAQVPSYVPTSGLIGWWPFTGNANDNSVNLNNGTVYGATLTTDRYGNPSCAYSFNGLTNSITATPSTLPLGSAPRSVHAWFNTTSGAIPTSQYPNLQAITGYGNPTSGAVIFCQFVLAPTGRSYFESGSSQNQIYSASPVNDGVWHNIVTTYGGPGTRVKMYIDGVINDSTAVVTLGTSSSLFGIGNNTQANIPFQGKIDDVGMWNRALTQQEITNLYSHVSCINDLTISPVLSQLQTGNTAIFNASTSDLNPSYVWQSDFGQGYQTLSNYGNYSGVNTNALSIANVQLSEHNQPIRVITTSGTCIDTSNIATINITDTCIVTINDTITTLISVTDTLIINTTVTGLTPPNNLNTIKVFPNPANDHITINYGNFASMSGYTLKITNNLGQVVFTTPINQQSSYIDLSTWTGNGIYFVQIIDNLNNTVENRKIVLQ